MLEKALGIVRNSIKVSRLHLIEELWPHCETEKKQLISVLKDERILLALKIDPITDEFIN